MKQKHVLVVDDDPLILDVVQRALASPQISVLTARRVSVARDVLARANVDLVITDARIPGESGLDLAESVRHLGIPVIIMSGHPEWIDHQRLCPTQYLLKPFDMNDLRRLVRASVGTDRQSEIDVSL